MIIVIANRILIPLDHSCFHQFSDTSVSIYRKKAKRGLKQKMVIYLELLKNKFK